MKKPTMTAGARRLFAEARSRERREFALPTERTMSVDAQAEHAHMASEGGVPADREYALVLQPELEVQLTRPGSSLTGYSILEEIYEAHMTRTLEPFTLGPIGAYKRRPKPKTFTLSNWPELARKAMLELRAKNDAALTALEARR